MRRAIQAYGPACPSVISTDPRYTGGDSGHDLDYHDGYLYLAGRGENFLMILHVESERVCEKIEDGSG
jgi:hypothetical protein